MSEEMNITTEDGKKLVKFVRKNIENYLETGKRIPIPDELKKKFNTKCGAFVTLNKHNVSGNPLRGCIGYIEPEYDLCEVLHRVSINSACEDPRFPSVSIEEMDNIVIEISILTPPDSIQVENPEDIIKNIEVGKDGLIIEKGMRRGLLLPQVPVEHGRDWDAKTFLEQTCQKAWLSADCWKEESTKIFKFQAILFEETEPRGEIVRKAIH
ncbi:MAG: TIGR00296 family protein [Promethearchaeati archaeon]